MRSEDIYREFVVRSAEIEEHESGRRTFRCQLEGWGGHRVAFDLIISGCSGESHYRSQYDVIASYCKVGALLHCGIVYRRRCEAFIMCINRLLPVTPLRDLDRIVISADTYFNPRRGFGIDTRIDGEWVDIPGVIELGGASCIPLVEEDHLPLVEYRHRYDKGLLYGKRQGIFGLLWRWAFVR